jgi:4'-phosphopantetheinyl transferase EntD
VIQPIATRLFPIGVEVVETCEPGDERTLLLGEASDVASAVRKRRLEFAAGRSCARGALAALGIAAQPLRVAADRRPHWPLGVLGSITHTDGYCAAACASRGSFAGVGIDAERVGRLQPELWPDICTPRESAWLASLPPHERAAMATLIFSAKEAYYKCQYEYTRAWLDFHDVEVTIDGDRFTVGARGTAAPAGRFVIENTLVVTGIAMAATAASAAR